MSLYEVGASGSEVVSSVWVENVCVQRMKTIAISGSTG